MTIITSVNTALDLNSEIRTNSLELATLLIEVAKQLKIVSMKLDCLQPDSDIIDGDEIDTLELQ